MQIAGNIAGVNAASENAASPRLLRAAHEFEGQMMKELLKQMTGASLIDGEDDAGSGGALNDFASEALGQALSQHGGFGIANRIVKDLSHSGNQNHGGKVTGNPHGNNAVSISE